MGQDGEGTFAQGDFARDAFGFTLSYFEGDYTAIGTGAVTFEIAMGGMLETWRNDLWNVRQLLAFAQQMLRDVNPARNDAGET
jgi:hypothetical protein